MFSTILPLVDHFVLDYTDKEDEVEQTTLTIELSDYFEKRKVVQKKQDDNNLAYCDNNVVAKAPKLEHGDERVVYCPEQKRIRNEQEYKGKKIDETPD